MGKKRSSVVVSPIQKESKASRLTDSEMSESDSAIQRISELDKQLLDIVGKEAPTNKDLVQMITLTSARDTLKYQWQVIPQVVTSILNEKLSCMMAEGGSLREAISFEVDEATSGVVKTVAEVQHEVGELTRKLQETRNTPKKWNKIVELERRRHIEDSRKEIVIFGHATTTEETGNIKDEALRDLVDDIVGEEPVESWCRMTGRIGLKNWNKTKPPTISIRLRSPAAREEIMKRARTQGQYNVKRRIPDLLYDEFKELSKEAQDLREREGCQTYIGFWGADVCLRQRKDSTDRWKTVKKL